MKQFIKSLAPAALLGVLMGPGVAQDIGDLSAEIGAIERGFWTRPVSNLMIIDGSVLEIHQNYITVVEWSEPGVPARVVSDTQIWRLPLDGLDRVDIIHQPGAVLLEGEDQDTYCPLTVAQFSCDSSDLDCDQSPKFYTCRYNKDELLSLLDQLRDLTSGALTIKDASN